MHSASAMHPVLVSGGNRGTLVRSSLIVISDEILPCAQLMRDQGGAGLSGTGGPILGT